MEIETESAPTPASIALLLNARTISADVRSLSRRTAAFGMTLFWEVDERIPAQGLARALHLVFDAVGEFLDFVRLLHYVKRENVFV